MTGYKYGVFGKNKLYSIFGTPVKQVLIRFLSENPTEKFSVLDLQKKTELPGSSISVALSELEDEGLVSGEKDGKFKYYSLSKKYAEIFSEIYTKLDEVYQIALRSKKKKLEVVNS